MVPASFGCGSAVLAAMAMLAPSSAARLAMARPMPRLAPVMNSVLPLRSAMLFLPLPARLFRGGAHRPVGPPELVDALGIQLSRHQAVPHQVMQMSQRLADGQRDMPADIALEQQRQRRRHRMRLPQRLQQG